MSDQFRITYADGRVDEVHVIPSARRAYEQEHNESILHAMESLRSDWADEIVWHTLRLRHGLTEGLDEWLLTVDRLELLRPVDPTSGTGQIPDDSSTPPSTPDSPSTD